MNCSACHTPMESVGRVPVRVGGTTGVRHLFFGDWADAREKLLPLDVYRCERCKRVEFFDSDSNLPIQH